MIFTIDSHQHFWSLDRGDYDWLTPDLEVLYRDFLPADLSPLLISSGVKKTVLVQAAPTLAETNYLLELAEQNNFVAGVVGWVDMDQSQKAVASLMRLSEHDAFLGIRPMIQDINDPKWMLNTNLEPVFRALIDFDLCFDALVRPPHLPYLYELLGRSPNLKVVIDHGAKPNIAANEWEPWSTEIANIAEHTSAYCKLSGLITEADARQPHDVLWPFCQHLLEQFGANRLMWGSDWPVLNLSSNYIKWHADFSRWLSPLSDDQREAISGHTAIEFYGLSIS